MIIKPITEMRKWRLREEGLPWATQGPVAESPGLRQGEAWVAGSAAESLPLAPGASIGQPKATPASLSTPREVSFYSCTERDVSLLVQPGDQHFLAF